MSQSDAFILETADRAAVRDQLFALLAGSKNPAAADDLLLAIQQGRLDGGSFHSTAYGSDEFVGCAWGHVANSNGTTSYQYKDDLIEAGVVIDHDEISRFLIWVDEGDTPETSPVLDVFAAIVQDYIDLSPYVEPESESWLGQLFHKLTFSAFRN
jgi:hypothetical protein